MYRLCHFYVVIVTLSVRVSRVWLCPTVKVALLLYTVSADSVSMIFSLSFPCVHRKFEVGERLEPFSVVGGTAPFHSLPASCNPPDTGSVILKAGCVGYFSDCSYHTSPRDHCSQATYRGWPFLELEQFLPAVLSLSLHRPSGTHCRAVSSTRIPWQNLKSD